MNRYTDVSEMYEEQDAWDELLKQAYEDTTPPREPIVLVEPAASQPHDFTDQHGYSSRWCKGCGRQIHAAARVCPGTRKPALKVIQGDKL